MSSAPEVSARPAASPPPELLERVRSAVAQAPTGPGASYRARLAMGTCVAAATVTVVAMVSRRDFQALPLERLLVMSGEVLLLAILAVVVATARGKQGLGLSVALLGMIALAVTPLYALATLVSPLQPVIAQPMPSFEVSVRTGLMCTAFGMGSGAIVLAAFSFALRRAVPAAPVLRGASLGAAAGAAAGLALHLFCPHFDRAHILIGHVLPIGIFVAVGALVTPRLLRP